jgi:ABC-type branched-subunit amino acid transport system substrate-binding protein
METTGSHKRQRVSLIAIISLVIVLFLAAAATWNARRNAAAPKDVVKIGIISDLSGGAAYWGESTVLGANLAKQDLAKEGYDVSLVFEDYQLQAPQALSAATKLVSQDKVGGIYAEFNPAAYAVSPYLKDKDVLFVYGAAPTSPLKDSDNNFKTYLDYEAGCRAVARKFKDAGIAKIGSLKVSQEFGDLCNQGIKSVYGDNMVMESYDLGDTDFKTSILKMESQGAQAVINTGFEADTLNTLKIIKEQHLDMKYGTVGDTVTPQVVSLYADQLKGGYAFGFSEVGQAFKDRVTAANGGKEPSTYYGAALAYTHVMQMAKALAACGADRACADRKIAASPADATIGFNGFVNRIADLDTAVTAY